MKNKFEILTGRTQEHFIKYDGFTIHKDIMTPFQSLQSKAKEEIGSNLKIISSYRNYHRQETIWNEKIEGIRPIFDENDVQLFRKDFTDTEFIEKIMRFSALPGTSRHHWGTDIDIFDANEMTRKDVQLTNSECVGSGPFSKLHLWLDQVIEDNQSFGFYRPYENGNTGVAPEKWHLSHAPLAHKLFTEYDIEIYIKNLEQSNIFLKEIILKDPEHYFDVYLKNINLPW